MSRFDGVILAIFASLLVILHRGKCVKEAVFYKIKGKYLPKRVIKTFKASSETHCSHYCLSADSCASVNFQISGVDKGLCELNNGTLKETNNGESKVEYNYLEIIPKSCEDKTQFFSKKSKRCISHASCKDLLAKDGSSSSGVYKLQVNDSLDQYSVYCHMTEIPECGPRGWTLVMKMNGSKNTFNYESSLWTNKKAHAVKNGLEGLTDNHETKLASYWNTPFNKICLGMKVDGVTNWITTDHQASSLYDVIANGSFIKTTAGKEKWKSLITGSSLQSNCNEEGFNIKRKTGNIHVRVRIGLIANNELDCDTCDSYIGYGSTFLGCGENPQIACGNLALCPHVSIYNTNTKKPAFGYILVQ